MIENVVCIDEAQMMRSALILHLRNLLPNPLLIDE